MKGVLFILMLLMPAISAAQAVVLDEEFNQYAHTLAAPFKQKMLPDRAFNFVLIDSPDINAYVTEDNLIFIHSGLVQQAPSAAALQGVIAHELAHLALGHHDQRKLQGRNAILPILAGAAVGVGAAIAGAPQAGAAAMMGGQAAAIQTMLGYTRVQEREADKLALEALQSAGISGSGMHAMFQTLRTQGQLSYDAPPPWLVTHPLPTERLAVLAQHDSGPTTPEASESWLRLRAKVAALTQTPATTLRQYGDSSAPARYARALARLKQGRLDDAHEELAPLLQQSPSDAYYLETLAQIQTQRGQLAEAIQSLEKALQRVPHGLLLRYQLATLQQAQGNHAGAAANFRAITRVWPIWPDPWEGYGRASGAQGQLARAHLGYAQAALMRADGTAAKQSLALAQTYLKQTPDADAQQWAEMLHKQLEDSPPSR